MADVSTTSSRNAVVFLALLTIVCLVARLADHRSGGIHKTHVGGTNADRQLIRQT